MNDRRQAAIRAGVEALPKLLAIINRVGCLYGLNAEERFAQDKGAAALSLLRAELEARGEPVNDGSRAGWEVAAPVEAPSKWLPTAENINALPETLRCYVMELETLCDPAGIVRENTLLKDCNRGLQVMYRKAADGAKDTPLAEVEAMLTRVRELRGDRPFDEVRQAFNAAADRLDVLASKLAHGTGSVNEVELSNLRQQAITRPVHGGYPGRADGVGVGSRP